MCPFLRVRDTFDLLQDVQSFLVLFKGASVREMKLAVKKSVMVPSDDQAKLCRNGLQQPHGATKLFGRAIGCEITTM